MSDRALVSRREIWRPWGCWGPPCLSSCSLGFLFLHIKCHLSSLTDCPCSFQAISSPTQIPYTLILKSSCPKVGHCLDWVTLCVLAKTWPSGNPLWMGVTVFLRYSSGYLHMGKQREAPRRFCFLLRSKYSSGKIYAPLSVLLSTQRLREKASVKVTKVPERG